MCTWLWGLADFWGTRWCADQPVHTGGQPPSVMHVPPDTGSDDVLLTSALGVLCSSLDKNQMLVFFCITQMEQQIDLSCINGCRLQQTANTPSICASGLERWQSGLICMPLIGILGLEKLPTWPLGQANQACMLVVGIIFPISLSHGQGHGCGHP